MDNKGDEMDKSDVTEGSPENHSAVPSENMENNCFFDDSTKDQQTASPPAAESDVPQKTKKKKKKKSSGGDAGAAGIASNGVADSPDGATESNDRQKQMDALTQKMRSMQVQGKHAVGESSTGTSAPRNIDEAKKRKYEFWDTQPVPKIDEDVTCNEEITPDLELDQLRTEPYSLVPGFHWSDIDLSDDSQLVELYTLLNENYVEDEDNMFRFDYSRDFLRWALMPPGWLPQWHCGVRVDKNKKLVGFISAIPASLKIHDRQKQLVEINFLCVHKKLRKKRVAPVLIREITRRVNMTGLFQAVYTGGVVLPKPVATCRYWHRSLNPKKLIDCKFSSLSKNMTMSRTVKLYKLPDEPQTIGFQRMGPEHESTAFQLLSKYLEEFSMAPIFSFDEFVHWFRSRDGIVDSFVVVNSSGDVTDFCSFYTLPSSVIQHPVHKTLKAAYSFYNVARDTKWVDLMRDALIAARNNNFDVFNALDLMENKEFLEALKFGVGDGNLHYYLYNWKCPSVKPEQVGLVLQ